jgi:hypothetical protein
LIFTSKAFQREVGLEGGRKRQRERERERNAQLFRVDILSSYPGSFSYDGLRWVISII